MRRHLFSVSISDQETRETIRRVYHRYGVVLEPHGAVGWRGLEVYLERFGDFPLCVSLETAHPAKFPEEVEALLGIPLELPQSMRDIDKRTGEPLALSRDYKLFKTFLQDTLKIKD
jgi:threonine synthase